MYESHFKHITLVKETVKMIFHIYRKNILLLKFRCNYHVFIGYKSYSFSRSAKIMSCSNTQKDFCILERITQFSKE